MPAPTSLSPLALALGRIPTGLYVVTADSGGTPIGFVGSFVMQVGFQPPLVCVAIGKDRPHLVAIRETRHFGISVLDTGSEALMKRFFRSYEPGKGPFDGLGVTRGAAGSAVLDDALAWLDCRWKAEQETGDHVVVFGEVVDAKLVRAGDPSIHLRKNGLGY
jgi:3-hydroxy-9,10-secoandrosta-1,3,5(10)-triene-9,17-dione monooxygenase reductase component